MKKRVYGLIGFPLSHSFSANYFAEKFERENIKDAEYRNFETEDINGLHSLIEKDSIRGLNVTIPYKEKVIPFLDELSPEAKAAGAVNTIKITDDAENKKLTGYNTDIYGFSMSLKPFLLNIHERALILGTGGASKAVHHVLNNLGIECRFVSQSGSGDFSYEDLNQYIISSHLLLINTTPAGMYPDIDNYPKIPYQYITKNHLVYDLIYNPAETLFLKKSKERGAVIMNGLSMLRLQAEKSWEIWNS